MRPVTRIAYLSLNGSEYGSEADAVAADVAFLRSALDRDVDARVRQCMKELKWASDLVRYSDIVTKALGDISVVVAEAKAKIEEAQPKPAPVPEEAPQAGGEA